MHFINGLHAHLQHQRDAGREEGHKHKVVGQDRHAAEAAHDFQLTHTWKILEKKVTHESTKSSKEKIRKNRNPSKRCRRKVWK